MGGGGVMRAAAKLTGIGVMSGGGPRGIPSMPTSENIFSSAARNATRPTAAIVSSRDGGEESARVQRPSWELEDWEFAAYESDPLPRVVFGGVPTMEEAKEATSDLKDALENVYLKSASSSCSEGSLIMGQEPNFSMLLSNSEFSETKASLTCDTAASKNAVQAFKFLSESPAAQTVVASIACDPNVWDAVMQNKELTKYIQSQKIAAASSAMDLNEQEYPNNTEKTIPESQSGDHETSFSSFIENLKCTVVDMFTNLSSFVQNTFGGSVSKKKSSDTDDDSDDKVKFMETSVIGSSFVGLAMFVIMLVVLKRA